MSGGLWSLTGMQVTLVITPLLLGAIAIRADLPHQIETRLEFRQFSEAETALERAYSLFDPELASSRSPKLDAMKALIDLYRAWQRPEQEGKWQGELEALEAGG